MTVEDGAERLVFHAQSKRGAFLDMLRPFRGLHDDVLRDVWDALKACAPMLRAEQIARPLMSAIWAISHLGRLWALDPEGMLRRNALISDADLAKLGAFLDRYDLAVTMLLDGVSPEIAFEEPAPAQ
jgi:hypothetical protein